MNISIHGINHVTFSVSDLDKSILFYQSVFEAKLLLRAEGMAYLELCGLWLALNVQANIPRQEIKQSYTHLAFTLDAADIQPMKQRLEWLGVDLRPDRFRMVGEGQSLYFADPDGHLLEFHTSNLVDRLQAYKEYGVQTMDEDYAAPYSKVAAFVTRESDRGRELLVFRHPSAGIQLPAGSVEPGEAAEAAVLREVEEETGLVDIMVAADLGIRTYLLPDNGRIAVREVTLRHEPNGIALEGSPMRCGHTVHEIQRTHGYAKVELRDYVMRDGVLQIDKVVAAGWLSIKDLSCSVDRRFFHIKTTLPTRDEWTWLAEGEHNFKCYWVPLADDPGLISGQDNWLTWFVHRLQETG